jgi:hypothetical protein
MGLITMNDMAFVGPDMKTYVTYKLSNIIEIAECYKDAIHTVACFSSNIIEVFTCVRFNYLKLKRSHYI